MIGFELGLKINFHGGGGGWLEQMGIRLTSASTAVGVEVGSELGKRQLTLIYARGYRVLQISSL